MKVRIAKKLFATKPEIFMTEHPKIDEDSFEGVLEIYEQPLKDFVFSVVYQNWARKAEPWALRLDNALFKMGFHRRSNDLSLDVQLSLRSYVYSRKNAKHVGHLQPFEGDTLDSD